MIHRILVNPGTQQAWEIPLRPGVTRIGCSPENDFAIEHPSISPQHCELFVSNTGVLLKDLGSQNGTFVDGNPVREIWLQSGQRVQIGAIETVFESRQTASAASPVNQPAPGATIIVAGFGSPPATPPLPSIAPTGQPIPDLDSPSLLSPAQPSTPPKRSPVHQAAEREAIRRKQFILGIGGAVTGSLIGVLAWFILTKVTGSPLLVMAWGVGGATGLGALFLAKRGDLPLGIAASICALIGIISGECLAVKVIRTQEAAKQAVAAYRSQLEFAKEVLRADSLEKVRKLLAQINEKSPEEITDDQIKSFQEEEQPKFRDFALGKPSKAEFVSEMETKFTQEFSYKEYFLNVNAKSGLFMVLFAVLGIATACKVGSSESAKD